MNTNIIIARGVPIIHKHNVCANILLTVDEVLQVNIIRSIRLYFAQPPLVHSNYYDNIICVVTSDDGLL